MRPFSSLSLWVVLPLWAILMGGGAEAQLTTVIDTSAYQQVRYVSIVRGSDITFGGSRTGPWKTLPYALDKITDASSSNRYLLIVGEGTYTGEDSTAFTLKPYVDIYGGFETYYWKRDIIKNPTVLDGEGLRRVVKAAGYSTLDGVWITGGSYNYPYDVYGAGVLFENVQRSVLSNCSLTANRSVNGGAICAIDCSPNIADCNIFSNTANGGSGGGICCWEKASPTIQSCKIRDNHSLTDGGGLYCRQDSSPTLTNCLIVENSANTGGGVYCLSSNPSLINCTLAGNSATEGGVLSLHTAMPLIKNSILWNNTGESALSTGSIPTLQYCIVPEVWSGIARSSLSLNPLFVGNGDYHLQLWSPCINQGIGPSADSSVPDEDIDGDARVGKVCDIGADERVDSEPTRTPEATLSPTSTQVLKPTSTHTPTATLTSRPTLTATRTVTPTPSPSGTATVTASPTPSATRTPTATRTPSPTSIQRGTPTFTATAAPTQTPTQTGQATPTGTAVLGDLNNDGSIGVADLLILRALWHTGPKDVK